jgi:hypothetical protein
MSSVSLIPERGLSYYWASIKIFVKTPVYLDGLGDTNQSGGDGMNRIKCDVSSCKYNEDGAVCHADEIEVKNNYGATAGASAQGDMELGEVGDIADARTSIETYCETFVPKKGSGAME